MHGTVGPSAWGPDVPFFPSFVDASAGASRSPRRSFSLVACPPIARESEPSDEELIAAESLALLLTDATWGDPLCSPGRGFPYQHARRVRVWVHRVQECHTERRGCAAAFARIAVVIGYHQGT
ncbi:hypothetical protein K0M31_011634 [Melipona bicolor]|uniref:Uncharacterized protein n=1 Tax=Melipona bicolor TaxID=60889 RepID=A0AA40G9X3_9HYME|nr:hypothetical protein K0M31_011634 [Melipona bicolor]